MSELRVDVPLDLLATLQPLTCGALDPTFRVTREGGVRASRTPEGAATLLLVRRSAARLGVRAFGPGADWAMAHAPDLVGLADAPPPLDALPEPVRGFARRARGMRLPRTHGVVELLVRLVLEQLVSGKEAWRAFAALVRRFSEPAPGPADGLFLPLGPEQLAAVPAAAFPALGVPPRQGETLHRIARYAARLEEADCMPFAAAAHRLQSVRGIGPWTAHSALLHGMGHADAVPLGDYHLPSHVAFCLAGERRADDARMLALLAPYAGQRGRVLRWLLAAGPAPARRAPRRPLRERPPEAPRLLR